MQFTKNQFYTFFENVRSTYALFSPETDKLFSKISKTCQVPRGLQNEPTSVFLSSKLASVAQKEKRAKRGPFWHKIKNFRFEGASTLNPFFYEENFACPKIYTYGFCCKANTIPRIQFLDPNTKMEFCPPPLFNFKFVRNLGFKKFFGVEEFLGD